MLFAVLIVCIVLFVVLPFLSVAVSHLLTTLFIGLLLGALARFIAPGSGRMGCVFTTLVGVAGSLLGTLAAQLLDTGRPARLLLQVAAAVVLVVVLRPTRKAPA